MNGSFKIEREVFLMKLRKQTALFIIVSFILLTLTGCENSQSAQMVNELSFPLDEITEITISYDDEAITFFESDSNNLIVKEYMNKNKEKYHAKVSEKSNNIKISEGGKPFSKDSFNRYIEVYLPVSYSEDLKITSTDGDVDITNMALNLSSIRIDCTSGTVKIKEVNASKIYLSSTKGKLKLESLIAEQIKIDTTQGDVTCNKIDGNVTYTSTSGNAEFKSAIGSGMYRANNSGKLQVKYTEVTGDISLFNKNDNVELTLPNDLNFKFEATTKNGSVKTNFQGNISVNGNTTSGNVGNNPTINVQVETKNGNIKVTK